MDTTPLKLAATTLLRQPVEQWIAERRVAGQSWRSIGTELRRVTKDKIDLHPHTVERWGTKATDELRQATEQAQAV